MNIDKLQKKKHIFKKRLHTKPKNIELNSNSRYYLFVEKRIRFELVYLRIFKKLLRLRSSKKKNLFEKSKFWIHIKPNYILSSKSTNARMGAGVGSIVRLAAYLNPYTVFVSFFLYSKLWLKKLNKTLRYRLPFKVLVHAVDIAYKKKY